MPTSAFDTIMTQTGVPALLRVLGVPATHTNSDGDDVAVTVILKTGTVAVGEFGERLEYQTTLQLASSAGARVGDVFTLDGTVTTDDPYPDDIVWTAVQLLNDDGYLRTFAVRSST